MDVFDGVLRKCPSLGLEILKYLHLWLVNMALLEGEDWETAGFLRYSTPNMVRDAIALEKNCRSFLIFRCVLSRKILDKCFSNLPKLLVKVV